MALAKSKLILISSLASATVLAASIGIGVGVSQNQQTIKGEESNLDSATQKDNKKETDLANSNNKDNNKPIWDNTDLILDFDGIHEADKELHAVLETVKPTNILLNKKLIEDKETKKITYAFDITESLVSLNEAGIKKPGEIKLELNLTSHLNTIKNLNEGRIWISVVAKNETTRKAAFRTFKFEGFKKPDESLLNLFDTQSATLDLTNEKSVFFTIEELNEKLTSEVLKQKTSSSSLEANSNINGINYVFKNLSSFSKDNSKDKVVNISIEGQVGLDKIETEINTNKTYFYIADKDRTGFLKLVLTKDNKKVSEALIENIKINNLLATDVNVSLINKNETKTKSYIEELKKQPNSNQYGYSSKRRDYVLEKELFFELNNNEQTHDKAKVFLKPNVLDSKEKSNTEFDIKYVVSFGSDDDAKTYDSTRQKDLEELKKIGFSFDLFTKKLSSTESKIKASDLNVINNLKLYLNSKTFNQPTDVQQLNQKEQQDKFVHTKVKTEELSNNLKVKLERSETTNNENHLVFAAYSYKGVEENKTLFSPSLTLVHIEKAST